MKNILAVRFSSLGDVVLTTGPIKYIKESLPSLEIDVLTSVHFAGVFESFPYVRNIYCVDRNTGLRNLTETLNTMPKYDAVIDLHDNLRSAFVKAVIPVESFTYDKNSLARRLYVKFRICRNRLGDHVVLKYFRAFASALNISEPPLERLRPYIPNPFINRISGAKKTVAIHPFASKRGKEWPFVYDLCEALLNDGLNVRVVGDGKMNLPPGVEDMTGFTPLPRLIRNIADCDLFVSTDSGPMHIATALGLPLIAIFGPTTKEMGFYPAFGGCSVIEDVTLKCRPCHIHGPDVCPLKHFDCMLSASLEEVRSRIVMTLEHLGSLKEL